jgi:hypothetical protein
MSDEFGGNKTAIDNLIKQQTDKIDKLEAEKAELIEILEPIKRIIDMYELYNELSIELIYDKLKKYIETKS